METINWEAVQAVSEALGLIVVVGSLVFVGFQIRQNAQATRAASMNTIMDSWGDMYMRVSESDKLAEIVWNGTQDPNAVSGVERFRFSIAVTSFLHSWHNTYYQWKIGTYDSEAWSAQVTALINFFSLPGIRATWNDRRNMFPQDFQMYVETEIISKSGDSNFKLAGT